MSAPAPTRSRRGLVGLFAADGVSTLGTRMSALAVPWFVLVTTGSATAAGITAFAELGPYVLAQALGGPAVDRLGAWRTRIGSDLVAAVGVGVVPLLYAMGALPLGALCGVLAVVGIARGFGDTAGYVLVPGVVERAGTAMPRATGMHEGVRRIAGLVGAPLAGLLVAVTSAPAVLVVDAVSFATAALVVLATVPRTAQPPRAEPASRQPGTSAVRAYGEHLAEGFRFLRHDRLLLGIAVMVTVTNLLDQASSSVLSPVWAADVAHSAVALGLMSAALGAGAVTGNLAVAWLGARLPRRLTFGVGFVLAGAPRFVALALASSISPVLGVIVLGGLGAGVLNPILGAVEFERIPRDLQARVFGATNAVAWVGMPFGGLLAGLAVDHVGLRAALWIVAAAYGLTTLVPFVFPAWKGLDDHGPAGTGPGLPTDADGGDTEDGSDAVAFAVSAPEPALAGSPSSAGVGETPAG